VKFSFTRRRDRAREEALAWLARLKRGLRESEGPQLLQWLERASHRALIAKAAAEWHGPEVLAVLSEIFPIDPQILQPRRRRSPATMAAAVAAGACLAALPILIANRHMPGLLTRGVKGDSLMESVGEVYATNPGTTRRVALGDGTHVVLNAGTRIAVAYSEHLRAVLVARGEASFEVATEPHRPFHVHAGGRDFEAKSAVFDVRVVAPNRMDLMVVAGTVTVFPGAMPADPTLVGPLQSLEIAPDAQSGHALSEQDVRRQLAWRPGT
jgi:transmembrane sensor